MIAAFLLPFPFRGYRAPYLWVFYRLLSLPEKVLFIFGEDYLRAPRTWRQQDRWEMAEHSRHRLGYRIPTHENLSRHRYCILGEDVFQALVAQSAGNPIAAFRRVLAERIPLLEARLADCLADFAGSGLEAVLTWCNCPSLKAAAGAMGIPVVHLEMGPLRWPSYRPTAYFDFSGVNGCTEAASRYAQASFGRSGVSADALRRFFFRGESKSGKEGAADAGVVLQVEDDSNLIAFGNGYDNQSLIACAHLRHPTGPVLVRPHPGSLFAIKPGWYGVDDSPDSVAFIGRCRHILTINSSVGLEAILRQVPVTVLGDCSYRFIAEADDEAERISRLTYYLFAYLVPMGQIFDVEYLRFRLSRPTDAQIVARHLKAFLGEVGGEGAAECSARELVEQAISTADRSP